MVSRAFELNSGVAQPPTTAASRWLTTTPMRLRAALVAGSLLAGVLGVVVLYGWAQHREAVKAVGVDAAPSVVAAHKIKIYIETLDADLANELLGKPFGMAESVQDFDKKRVE